MPWKKSAQRYVQVHARVSGLQRARMGMRQTKTCPGSYEQLQSGLDRVSASLLNMSCPGPVPGWMTQFHLPANVDSVREKCWSSQPLALATAQTQPLLIFGNESTRVGASPHFLLLSLCVSLPVQTKREEREKQLPIN